MKFIRLRLFAVIAFAAPHTTMAQPAGHDAPAFRNAVAAWLDNDDQTALPALAKLAQSDNRAAQVLLGRIATRPMGPWLAGLERKERKALLRAPGGLSGTSWLKVAAEAGDPLAQAFLEKPAPRADESVMRRLAELGEPLAAADLANMIQLRRGAYPQDVAAALWRKGRFPGTYALSFATPIINDNQRDELEALQRASAFPFNAILRNGLERGVTGAEWVEVIRDWYAEAAAQEDQAAYFAQGHYDAPTPPHLATARAVCDAACGPVTDIAASCFGAFSHAMSPTATMRRTITPSHSLIDQSRYAGSKRGFWEFAKLMDDEISLRIALYEHKDAVSACFGEDAKRR